MSTDTLIRTGEISFERLKKEGLSPLKREYIIDKINLRRVQKNCLRVLRHCTVINVKDESYRLKERKEYMKQKQREYDNARYYQNMIWVLTISVQPSSRKLTAIYS